MPIKNSEQTEQSKKDVDRHLLAEALSEDRELTDYPLRHSRSTLQWQEGIPTQLEQLDVSRGPPKISQRAVSLLFHSLANLKMHTRAYHPIPDGSQDVLDTLPELAEEAIHFVQKLDTLHLKGVNGHAGLMSPLLILRLAQSGDFNIAGQRRKSQVGFEYEQLCCTCPPLLDIELELLSQIFETLIAQLGPMDNQGIEHTFDIGLLKNNLAATRFNDSDKFDRFSSKELVVHMLSSELQRFLAYLHPWLERVGRTSEEAMALCSLSCRVEPLFLSTPSNRSTHAGYERGIALAMTAIPVLRRIGNLLKLPPDEVASIGTVGELYEQMFNHEITRVSHVHRMLYRSPMKHLRGHNVFPDINIMRVYFTALHQTMTELMQTLTVDNLLQDPHTLHLTSHLLNRGQKLQVPLLPQN